MTQVFADMTEEELRKYRKLSSSRIYNFKNAEARNEKTRARMAKRRAQEGLLSAEEQAALRERRREATQRYREKLVSNRPQLASAEKRRRRRYRKKPELQEKNLEKFRERKASAAAARQKAVLNAGLQAPALSPLVAYSSDED
ncbi:hypothetical protein B0H15DRAFT_950422 [Mycena belliarum]|uniref:Uncharacterized protein n=1 Tax=Mycena belliarum TaxID=1033014 RepID=A0AAD6TLI0_9AGAR|nr:hypothetical protein B0H15DRAFT_958575 [Mycena belliae]KAJ7086911.1 hypothetical protein B0H15DRAFT_950422 [Mycena belliae]